MNPWHDVNYGDEAPTLVNAVIEIPKGSKGKYEIDKVSGLLKLDRVLFSSVHYPANYGFIPQTYCEDGDPLDILVLSSVAVPALCIMNSKVIGVMRMTDQGEEDDKIIAVANDDISVNYVNTLHDLPPHTLVEVKRFFQDYKKLENKKVIIEEFLDIDNAHLIIKKSISLYNKTFKS